MYSYIVLLCLLAGASAAPHYHYPPAPYYSPQPYNPGFPHSRFNDDIFDTRRFWADLATEMRELDDMLSDFYKKFPSIESNQQVVGNEYRITIPLSGFEEKDIKVKAREGLLMVQAVKMMPGGGQRSYLDIKTLPSNVNVTGNWIFEKNVLKITFPMKETEVVDVTDAPVLETSEEPEKSREEMENHSSDDNDADVGLRGDRDNKDREVFTNEIPNDNRYDMNKQDSVEATTYAVDLKDEVEFVPVRY